MKKTSVCKSARTSEANLVKQKNLSTCFILGVNRALADLATVELNVKYSGNVSFFAYEAVASRSLCGTKNKTVQKVITFLHQLYFSVLPV